MDSVMRRHEDFCPWALIITTRVQDWEKHVAEHCTFLVGFINITAGDCGKALDKIPEEHGCG